MKEQKNSGLSTGNKFRTFLIYLLMVLIAGGIYYFIFRYGKSLQSANGFISKLNPAGNTEQINHLLHVLLALAVVIITARGVGALFKLLGQPPVIGEVVGGILLGPSFLGKYAPETFSYVLPKTAIPFLGVIAQLGVIFYMFVVGLELDLKVLRKSGHAALAISHASIVVPFLLGAWLATQIYTKLAPSGIPFLSFSLILTEQY
jgi:hypothetical protein